MCKLHRFKLTSAGKARNSYCQKTRGRSEPAPWGFFGAGKEVRTPDLDLGKVALYQLSYSRIEVGILGAELEAVKPG